VSEINPIITVKALGEQGLLQLLHQFCPPSIVGDDAAVIQPRPGYELVVTTDVLVDGVHFSDRTIPPEALGWRAAAVNLSDLAAMGAESIGITVGLGLPDDTSQDWIIEVYSGLSHCLRDWGGVILGGDVVRSESRILSITALGEVRPQTKILRHRAHPGEVILVTGFHGGSRAGLELLVNPTWGQDLSEAHKSQLIQLHQRPTPRINVARLLRSQSISCAGMDSSDGLADAVVQICRASQVGAVIECDRLPIHPDLLRTQSLTPAQAIDWTLYGGEDFELVLTLAPDLAKALQSQLPQGAEIIGKITAQPEIRLIRDGISVPLSQNQGFQHW
jgi:thiamine-monophosphate kinase